ncbi:MAG: aminoacyl-tRNA hydrolase [Anaerolineae bacterium UTCFX2]|jgi:PTH1 family peptidyl-tRNA hydrolase|nr:aminoacyl-tRNA hydrolase [Anaerolineales bacterium]OQY91430.1 MAG: aminoacyl-tRNA hydrolase [Anaerolineae bacterium UTCFX2]
MILKQIFGMNNETPAPVLVAGLGNPGAEYRDTRHNVGFIALDHLAHRLGVRFSRYEHKALVVKTEFENQRMLLVKPQTYMNLSGQSIAALVRYYKVPLEGLLVAYDDIDLPFGMLRLRPGGGSAGHKGMKSIIEKLGTQEFPRLRIGVGRPQSRKGAAGHVLNSFSASEMKILEHTLETCVEAILTYVRDGLEVSMNRFNGEIETQ